jgi:hypothetical protein
MAKYKDKIYDEHVDAYGHTWVDASKHGIHDVYAAAKYAFEQMGKKNIEK